MPNLYYGKTQIFVLFGLESNYSHFKFDHEVSGKWNLPFIRDVSVFLLYAIVKYRYISLLFPGSDNQAIGKASRCQESR